MNTNQGESATPASASNGGAPAESTLGQRLQGAFADIGWVALGGALGALARWLVAVLVAQFVPAIYSGLAATMTVNVVGAFALGLLATALDLPGSATGWRRRARLFFGTGMLGGFTTYSLFAHDTALLITAEPFALLWYSLGTLVLGAFASFAGMRVATIFASRNRQERP